MVDKYSERRFDVSDLNAIDRDVLEAIPNQYPGRETEVEYFTEEFTAVCPWTGLPDQGTITITYVPDKRLIELKSLKYYLLSYRNVGILQENAVNSILDDLVKAVEPKRMEVYGVFALRGGLGTRVRAQYKSESKEKE